MIACSPGDAPSTKASPAARPARTARSGQPPGVVRVGVEPPDRGERERHRAQLLVAVLVRDLQRLPGDVVLQPERRGGVRDERDAHQQPPLQQRAVVGREQRGALEQLDAERAVAVEVPQPRQLGGQPPPAVRVAGGQPPLERGAEVLRLALDPDPPVVLVRLQLGAAASATARKCSRWRSRASSVPPASSSAPRRTRGSSRAVGSAPRRRAPRRPPATCRPAARARGAPPRDRARRAGGGEVEAAGEHAEAAERPSGPARRAGRGSSRSTRPASAAAAAAPRAPRTSRPNRSSSPASMSRGDSVRSQRRRARAPAACRRGARTASAQQLFVGVVERERVAGLAAALEEQPQRVVVAQRRHPPTPASPGTPSGSRLVASTAGLGAGRQQRGCHLRRAVEHLLAVVEADQQPAIAQLARSATRAGPAPARRGLRWRPPPPRRSAAFSVTAPRSTHQTPSRHRPTCSAMACAARRVFPAPPGPTRVTDRSSASTRCSSASSSRRPTNVVGWTGRLCAASSSERSGAVSPASRGRSSNTALGQREVAQAVDAAVAQLEVLGQRVARQRRGRGGEHDLAAVRDLAQALRAAQRGARVAAVGPRPGGAGVQRDAHLPREVRAGLAQDRRRGEDGVGGRGERGDLPFAGTAGGPQPAVRAPGGVDHAAELGGHRTGPHGPRGRIEVGDQERQRGRHRPCSVADRRHLRHAAHPPGRCSAGPRGGRWAHDHHTARSRTHG